MKKNIPSNIEWQQWGKQDPFYGVSTPIGRDKNQRSSDDFYNYGKATWKTCLNKWETYGLDNTNCVEIGCGTGRITMHLAKDFYKVHAIDVSQGMIETAKRYVDAPSVEFHLTNGITLPFSNQSISAVYSTHVFQHLESFSWVNQYFKEIYRMLAFNGTIMIGLPVYKFPFDSIVFNTYLTLWNSIHEVYARWLRALIRRGIWKPFMRMHYFPSDYLFEMVSSVGYSDILVSTFNIPKYQLQGYVPETFLFARKAIVDS